MKKETLYYVEYDARAHRLYGRGPLAAQVGGKEQGVMRLAEIGARLQTRKGAVLHLERRRANASVRP